MRFVKQKTKLFVTNLDNIVNQVAVNMKSKRHGVLLPDSIRCIICGPSNCGKTNLILNLLFSPQGLCFDNVYIFSKSLYQKKYKFLKCVLEDLPDVGYYPFSENDEVPHPNEVKPNSIMIFDDVACDKQTNIKNFFCMGRHNKIDTFYLCQTYSFVPKQLVRDNTNLIIIFKQDDKNIKHIYHDHVNMDMTFDQFKKMCSKVWNTGRNKCLVIDKDSDIDKGRYRLGF